MKPKNFDGMRLLRKIRVVMRQENRSDFNSNELESLKMHRFKRLSKISRRSK